jgi:hypothetical protein
MSANAGWNKLNHALATLREKWDQTEPEWRDQVRREFAEEYLEPLEIQVSVTLRGIKRLEETLRAAKRQCSDSRK